MKSASSRHFNNSVELRSQLKFFENRSLLEELASVDESASADFDRMSDGQTLQAGNGLERSERKMLGILPRLLEDAFIHGTLAAIRKNLVRNARWSALMGDLDDKCYPHRLKYGVADDHIVYCAGSTIIWR